MSGLTTAIQRYLGNRNPSGTACKWRFQLNCGIFSGCKGSTWATAAAAAPLTLSRSSRLVTVFWILSNLVSNFLPNKDSIVACESSIVLINSSLVTGWFPFICTLSDIVSAQALGRASMHCRSKISSSSSFCLIDTNASNNFASEEIPVAAIRQCEHRKYMLFPSWFRIPCTFGTNRPKIPDVQTGVLNNAWFDGNVSSRYCWLATRLASRYGSTDRKFSGQSV